jgi:hypothetical protein
MQSIWILQQLKSIQTSESLKSIQTPKLVRWAYPSLALLIVGLTVCSGQLLTARAAAHNSNATCIQGTAGYNGNSSYNSHGEPDGSDVSSSPSNPCASGSNQSPIRILGMLTKDNMDQYCQQRGIPGASTANPITTGGAQRDGDNAYAWKCHRYWTGTSGGDAPGTDMSMKAVCQWVFNDNNAEDRLLNYWNTHPQHPTSSTDTTTDTTSAWECFTNATLVGGINLTGYCQSLGYQNYVHDGSTAYDFRCTGNGMQDTGRFDTWLAACQLQYQGYAYVIDRLAADDGHGGYTDPTSWECWGSKGGNNINSNSGGNPSVVSSLGQIKIYGTLTKTQLASYCASQAGYTNARVVGNKKNAYNWRCVSSNGTPFGLINMEEACRSINNDQNAEDRLLNYNDPNSWECFGNAHLAGGTDNGVYDLPGYCQSRGFANMQLQSENAYGFVCVSNNGTISKSPFQHVQDASYSHRIPFSMQHACQWQYSQSSASAGVIDRLAGNDGHGGYNDVRAWECWIGGNSESNIA